MCDKKNSVLFAETECLVLSPDFKLLDESQVLLKVPSQNNMYNFDLKNVVPSGGLTYLFAKATIDKSNLWHRRLGPINFKTMNKLVKGNLVRGEDDRVVRAATTASSLEAEQESGNIHKTRLIATLNEPSPQGLGSGSEPRRQEKNHNYSNPGVRFPGRFPDEECNGKSKVVMRIDA
ncbi:putative ribonuclease H-like domain-containing protein [Tanacetum coccineum]